MTGKLRVLIVEDEEDLARIISYNLTREGYEPEVAHSGDEALALARANKPALVILDLMLPGMGGLEVCRVLRSDDSTKHIPVIMLTAKSEEVDKVIGLETGADDYMTKPFSVTELMARIRALLRRTRMSAVTDSLVRMGGIEINRDACTVSRSGQPVSLSATEYRLLVYLVENRGRVLSRGQILDAVWRNESNVEPRTVDVHIRKLRSLIEDNPSEPRYIRTRRGIGYVVAGEE